ncbi:hypothetical protein MRX96_054546 [Rhipicephalus microplus]
MERCPSRSPPREDTAAGAAASRAPAAPPGRSPRRGAEGRLWLALACVAPPLHTPITDAGGSARSCLRMRSRISPPSREPRGPPPYVAFRRGETKGDTAAVLTYKHARGLLCFRPLRPPRPPFFPWARSTPGALLRCTEGPHAASDMSRLLPRSH